MSDTAEDLRPHLYGARTWYAVFAGVYGLFTVLGVAVVGIYLVTGDVLGATFQGLGLLLQVAIVGMFAWMWRSAARLELHLEGAELERSILDHLSVLRIFWRIIGVLTFVVMGLYAMLLVGALIFGMANA